MVNLIFFSHRSYYTFFSDSTSVEISFSSLHLEYFNTFINYVSSFTYQINQKYKNDNFLYDIYLQIDFETFKDTIKLKIFSLGNSLFIINGKICVILSLNFQF